MFWHLLHDDDFKISCYKCLNNVSQPLTFKTVIMTFCLRFYVILTMYVRKYLFTRSPIIFGGGQNSEQEVSNEIVNV